MCRDQCWAYGIIFRENRGPLPSEISIETLALDVGERAGIVCVILLEVLSPELLARRMVWLVFRAVVCIYINN
jgi:hypothetical protein